MGNPAEMGDPAPVEQLADLEDLATVEDVVAMAGLAHSTTDLPADVVQVDPEVAAALATGRPVVALESAVITHGLPRPFNLEVARDLEAAVREAGAVPATIAVLDGVVRIGLDEAELARLADEPAARKCGTRDLAGAIAARAHGGTTVSATAWLAHRSGIPVFATGGLGGVHRGGPFDVSADLIELGRTPITVVCAGAKSLLDLPATLEVLETQGVAVLGYGTDRFPAFYVADSGLPVTARVESPGDVADIVRARDRLGVARAIVVAVPVPPEHALPAAEVEALVARATAEAAGAGVRGPGVTPWVLARMAELSGGRTLAANRALLVRSTGVAGGIAGAMGSR